MRVAFYGNICNNFFTIARMLRRLSTIDAHLYIDENADPQMRPESDDPTIAGQLPDWIHVGRYTGKAANLAPWRSPLLAATRDADVVVVSSLGPVYAQFCGKPVCFYVTGGDLNEIPFPRDFSFKYRSTFDKAAALVIGLWQARGIRRATEIWTQQYAPFRYSLERLRVDPKRINATYFPVVIDTQMFSPKDRSAITSPVARKLREDHDFIVFHPSRIMIRGNEKLHPVRDALLRKHNDRLFQGFAEFVKRTGKKRAALVMLDRAASPDIALARTILNDLGVSANVVWLVPPRPTGFTRAELVDLYAVSDVVADDFGLGWFGAVVLEGLAMAKPVLSYIDEEVMRTMYPSHPIVSVREPDAIADALERLSKDPEHRSELGHSGREWVVRWHAIENVGPLYVKAFIDLAGRVGLPKPSLREVSPPTGR